MWIKSRKQLLLGVLLWCCGFSVFAATLTDVSLRDSGSKNELVLNFSGKPSYGYFNLSQPERVVIDLRDTTLNVSLPKRYRGKLVESVRTSSPPQRGTLRLVLDLSQRVTAKAVTEKRGSGYQVVLSLTPIGGGSAKSGSTQTTSTTSRSVRGNEKVVIAIDPGHGGQDPGAVGKNGLREKQVTLAIAQKLRDMLNNDGSFRAVMTRERDYFISVSGRSDIARDKNAQLLISIHADAAPNRSAKGASVWVLSNRRANSEMGRWLEDHEKQSELLGGAGEVLSGNNNDRYLSQTVLDLQFGHSQRVGYDVASKVLSEMGKISPLHKRRPEHASLGVLRSPDIPSLLVETGFISNLSEERLLGSSAHQTKVATAIYRGIKTYYRQNPNARVSNSGSVASNPKVENPVAKSVESKVLDKPAQNNEHVPAQPGPIVEARPVVDNRRESSASTQTHTVKRGETLTRIAGQYGSTVAEMKALNRLRSGEVQVGQKLKVPVSGNRANSKPQPPVASQPDPVTEKRTVEKIGTQWHEVKRGENLLRIAERYHTSMQTLRDLNRLNGDQVNVGQKLRIPLDGVAQGSATTNTKTEATSTARPTKHKVKSGESLSMIAEKYGVGLSRLRQFNQLKSDQVMIGQTLKIPQQ
ncbi:N-acetylmuramoyl-L-alanine amidase [Plesiomonas sp.]|uniref:N-acetylmuramoyl-L-alanine amidase n=1 Tax=Plesiomonas sp. TaxID=2486279 RepID=UPI003F403BE7